MTYVTIAGGICNGRCLSAARIDQAATPPPPILDLWNRLTTVGGYGDHRAPYFVAYPTVYRELAFS